MLSRRLFAAVAAIVLLFAGIPGRAQLAFSRLAQPNTEAVGHDPEDGPKATAYKTVHGVVQGKLGALPGATVWLRGSRTVVVTNAEGEFTLPVPADASIIELTCGYAGLQDETVRLPSVQALGSVYLLRPHAIK